jgi:hypothetical protein
MFITRCCGIFEKLLIAAQIPFREFIFSVSQVRSVGHREYRWRKFYQRVQRNRCDFDLRRVESINRPHAFTMKAAAVNTWSGFPIRV